MRNIKISGFITVLFIVLILFPTVVLAKSFDNPNAALDAKYNGTNLTINKSNVSINQTVRVKLTLKIDGKKARGVIANLKVEKTTAVAGTTVLNTSTVTSSSGKAIWKFKLRDIDVSAVSGDTYLLTVDLQDGTVIGSTTIVVR